MAQDQQTLVADMAHAHHFSEGAVETVLRAMRRGGGSAAQFDHPDLGGMGQWSGGGMIMIGAMNDHALKDRVAKLCQDVSRHLQNGTPPDAGAGRSGGAGGDDGAKPADRHSGNWWPDGLGHPASTGAQNDMRYAFFPETKRLAIEADGALRVYDTGTHRLSGFSQSQSTGQSLAFSSEDGPVRLESLRELDTSR